MQFYEASYLKYLFFLPLLFVLGMLSSQLWRRRLLKLGYEPVVMSKLIPGYRRSESGIRIFLFFLVFLCLILALARPQWGESSKKVERKGVDVLFLLDTSLSMLSEDVKPNRFETAKREIKSIMRKLKGDRVGLVVFSGSAYLQTPLTLDYSAFQLFLESVKVGHVPDPGSSLSSALNYVLRIFPKEDLKYKVLILMTEGEDTLGGIDEALRSLREAKIRVYTIGMGTEAGGPIPLKDQTGRQVGFKKDRAGEVVISRMNPKALTRIAEETEGLFFPSTSAEREVDLLLKHLSSLGQKNINEKMIAEKEDHYGFFIFWALVFLLLESFVRRSQRIRPALMMLAALFLFSGFIETPRGLNKQGNEEFVQKKYQSAISNYQKAKVKDPDDGSIRYNLGTALYQTGQFRDARTEFQKAVDLSKTDPELQAKSYYNLGNAEYRLGNFEGAIKDYKEALKLNPKDSDAKSNLEFVQNQKSLFDKKNDERKKDDPKQNQQQDQQKQDQQNNQDQQQKQDQQNQDQSQKNQDQQQKQDPKNQDQNQQNQDQQKNQDQSQQDQQEGGQGQGSGQQQDSTNQPQDSQGQQNNEPKDSSGEQGQENKPDQKQPSQGKPEKEQTQQEQQKSPQPQEPQKPDQGSDEAKNPSQKEPEKSDSKGDQPSEQQQEQPPSKKDTEPRDQESQKQEPAESGEDQGEEPKPEQGDDQSKEPEGGEAGEQTQDLLGGEEQQQEQDNQDQSGDDQESKTAGQEKGDSGGGSGTQYQGQMSVENALKILDALHEGEKEFSDLRRPPAHRQQASVEKDW